MLFRQPLGGVLFHKKSFSDTARIRIKGSSYSTFYSQAGRFYQNYFIVIKNESFINKLILTLTMALENVIGNLLAYKQLEQGTFQHADQLTTERGSNQRLKDQWFYTADGEIYTVQKKGCIWAITREPQNLVLQDIAEAYRQLTDQGNYFPDTNAARASLDHENTVVVDLNGLELVKGNDVSGYFVVDPKQTKKLNSEQRRAAQRIFGPDEDTFGLNMDMFAEDRKIPYIFVLRPDYVQRTLKSNGREFLGRASWLDYFYYYFDANDRGVSIHSALRGVRRVIAEGDAPENEVS